MDVKGQHIVVVGLARSGLAVARFLQTHGARVTVTDQAAEAGLVPFVAQARQLGVDLELGGHREATFKDADLIVLSPGVPHTLSHFERARQTGIPVIGEIELAFRFIHTPIVAVTGTNGKTTTTELLGRMLASSGLRVFVGGNIGNPLIEIAERDAELDLIVAEISSFQLDTIETFRPHVAVLLNISADHLDRYPDLEAYAASKARVFMNQTEEDIVVCNGIDPLAYHTCQPARSRQFHFYASPPVNETPAPGALITPRQIAVCLPGQPQARIDLARCALAGPHNRENIAAASLAALTVGGSLEGIQKALNEFPALAHRLEPVGTVAGIHFVNDSKATNVDAVIRALECFDRPVVLIMGGRNKGYDFDPLQPHVRHKVKKLIVIGEAKMEILASLGQMPSQGAETASDMPKAVELAFAAAAPGETVLLSPACASFDMFGSYADRGDTFRRLVGALQWV
jgi:UDP-N-acetylmuramoylalanine--D-glutamate ligase